jgi:hypothetical protein
MLTISGFLRWIVPVVLLFVAMAALAKELTNDVRQWRVLSEGELSKIRVGAVEDRCCTKSKRTTCLSQPAFQCRTSPACTVGQVYFGTCLPAANCTQVATGLRCALTDLVERKVDKCTVIGTSLPGVGCPDGQAYCTWDYLIETDDQAPHLFPNPTLCDSTGQICNAQPLPTCDDGP